MLRALSFAAFIILAHAAATSAQSLPQAQAQDDTCQIAALIDMSAALELPTRVERALLLTLRTAGDAYHQGEIHRALTLLRTFTFEVRGARRAKRLPPDSADMLLARAEDAIRELARR
ncbi:MAG TPA: hypothetical protein VM115_13680 [Vicinamibacterales bacterium]|nr:hypothetical protein [Vicinamibacterales bacterium]